MPVAPLAPYDFVAPAKLIFGWGRRSELGTLAAGLGRRAFVFCGSRTLEKSGKLAELVAQLTAASVQPVVMQHVGREPEPSDVDRAVELIAERRSAGRISSEEMANGDVVIAIGGGSAIDLAKAAAAMATNAQGASVREFLEGVGSGRQIVVDPLPLIALPTTAGTGSEATKNAVISSSDPPFKKSLRSERMVPRAVLIDPELTVSAPWSVTSHSGLDAVTQLIESYISRRANAWTQLIALDGLRRAVPALEQLSIDQTDRASREQMAHAAYCSGLALANSGLGLAHGVAAALGCLCRVSHGLACAVMLPPALRFNRSVRQAEYAALERALRDNTPIDVQSHANGLKTDGSDAELADALVARIERFCHKLEIPQWLRDIGVSADQIPQLVPLSHGNSLSGNPRDVSDRELRTLLEELL